MRLCFSCSTLCHSQPKKNKERISPTWEKIMCLNSYSSLCLALTLPPLSLFYLEYTLWMYDSYDWNIHAAIYYHLRNCMSMLFFKISKYQVVAPTCTRVKKLMIWIILKLCRSLIELFLSWSSYCKYSFPLFIYNTARSLTLYVYESMHNFNVHSDYGVIDSNYWVAGTNHHIFISINSHGHFRNCLSKWCWQCYTYVFV